MLKYSDFKYKLIDCGDGGRIEQFGDLIIDRPCPQATWSSKLSDIKADIVFDRDTGWEGINDLPESWKIKIGNIQSELRFSKNGQVGIFPEQFNNWKWISEKISENKEKELKILNTFAYTGMSTLFASNSNTEVCHLDGAKSAVSWASINAKASGLGDNKIRWICDDVLKFMAREIRRGKKYDAIILDPPAFGRAGKHSWNIKKDLPKLMLMVSRLLVEKPLFVILTCHAPEHFSPKDLAKILEKLPQFEGQKAEKLILEIPSESGNPLPSSFGARISF